MKALTLWEPWATLIALGYKQFETRPWSTSHRGDLLIHAAATRKYCKFRDVVALCARAGLSIVQANEVAEALKPGHIVAAVRLGEITGTRTLLESGAISAQEEVFGDYGPDRYGWALHDVHRLKSPVPAKGMQQFWYPPEETVAAVLRQMGWPA